MKTRFLPALLATSLCLVLTGCENTDQGIPGPQLKANLLQIKLGMTEEQMRSMIGKPASITSQTSAGGTLDTWTYLGSQFYTVKEAMAVGAAEGTGLRINSGSRVYTFTNGRLTLITNSR